MKLNQKGLDFRTTEIESEARRNITNVYNNLVSKFFVFFLFSSSVTKLARLCMLCVYVSGYINS
jgi:hypothetical protein